MTTLTYNKKNPSQALVIAAFAALYIIWGSTYLAILIAIKSIPPFLMAGARFLTAGLILYSWCRFRGEHTPNLQSIRHISFSGILLLFAGNTGLVFAEQYLPTGLAAIMVAATPLWFVILDKRQWKFYFSNRKILLGLLIGFAGIVSLFAGKDNINIGADKMKLISFFVLFFGSICWATGTLYAKYQPSGGSTGMKAAIQMLTAGILSVITGIGSGELQQFHWAGISYQSLLALLYLITFGSLIGYLSFVWLMSVRPPALVGTYAYVNPVVAVFLGWLILHEPITWHQVLALLIILAGVIIVNFSKETIIKKDNAKTAAPTAR